MKDCLTPLITDIVNLCLRDGLPDTLKTAIIKPILKKPNLDSEKVVAERLIEHMQMNNLQEFFQSAYKQLQSTEPAVLKVQDHNCLDQGKNVVLLFLDIRAAFDTVDHELLLKALETTMGIKGQYLQWLTSYLEHRQQSASIGGVRSTTCGVPQGSLLGPLLFTIYTTPLVALLPRHDYLLPPLRR